MMLHGKTALITGANRGIGQAVATCFAEHGADLLLCARERESLEAFARALRQNHGISVRTFYFDLTELTAIKQTFQTISREKLPLDILVNNAGVLKDALLGMITQEQIDSVYATNVFAALHCAQYASRLIAKREGGSIINISSIVGVNGNAGQAVYAGSKAAVIGMTKSLAKELAARQIRVNAIAPGFIDTAMAQSLAPAIFQQRMDSIAMGRIGKPEDVANTALYLGSDLSAYVTGQIINVDGGMLI